MIPKDFDLRTISQILKTNILLLKHPRKITPSIMYPYVWMACFIIVVKQILYPLSLSRHVRLVDVLALQPLWWPRLQCVNLLQYTPDSHLKLNGLLRAVPDPRPGPWDLRLIPAYVEARNQAQISHLWISFCIKRPLLNRSRNKEMRWWWGQPNFHFLQLIKQEIWCVRLSKVMLSLLVYRKENEWSGHHALKACTWRLDIIIAILPLCLLFKITKLVSSNYMRNTFRWKEIQIIHLQQCTRLLIMVVQPHHPLGGSVTVKIVDLVIFNCPTLISKANLEAISSI